MATLTEKERVVRYVLELSESEAGWLRQITGDHSYEGETHPNQAIFRALKGAGVKRWDGCSH